MIVSFCAVLFPIIILDELFDFIESASEVFFLSTLKVSGNFQVKRGKGSEFRFLLPSYFK